MPQRMTRALHMNLLMAALAVVLLAILAVALGLVRGGAGETWRDVPRPVISSTGPAPDKGGAARHHAKLIEQARYHAAFAVGDGGAYGWSDSYATADMAESAALGWCRTSGANCRIVTRIAPEMPVAFEGQPLSRTAAQALQEFRRRPAPKAMALSDTGAWGMAWKQPGQNAAARAALANCQTRTERVSRPKGIPKGSCRVVLVR